MSIHIYIYIYICTYTSQTIKSLPCVKACASNLCKAKLLEQGTWARNSCKSSRKHFVQQVYPHKQTRARTCARTLREPARAKTRPA